MKKSVIIAHPGTQHSYQTALGLQEVDMLQRYVTGFYYKKNGFFSNLMPLFPEKYRERLERDLKRRRKEELNDTLIETFSLNEMSYIFMSRMKLPQKMLDSFMFWRNEHFDARVARMIEEQRPGAVICYDSSALKTFQACGENGVVSILDQSIGHIQTGIKLLREEAKLHPEFADSLSIDAPEWMIERCTAEALTADRILAGSEYVRDSLIDIGVQSSKITIIPYGVDIRRFSPRKREKETTFRILFVGQISQRKGIKYLLEAFRRLQLPNAELVLVGRVLGDGAGLAPYRDWFRHVQNVPHHEVHDLFQNANIFVYPSLHEGSALAVYEALASGLPVITTPNTGSVVRDGEEGFIVPIRNVEMLMEKIQVLYDNPELRRMMGQRARQKAEQYTWDLYRQRLAKILQELFEKKS